MDASGSGRCLVNGAFQGVLCQLWNSEMVAFGKTAPMLFFLVWTGPLVSLLGTLCCHVLRDFGYHASYSLATVWSGPFLFQHDNAPVHKARSLASWPIQSTDLNLTGHLSDEQEYWLHARHTQPTTMCKLVVLLWEEWKQTLPAVYQNLVGSLLWRITAIIIVKGGPTPY